MKVANITTVPKKGSRLLLTNERGIFRVSVIRSILMRLIYDSKYPEIDSKMSDSHVTKNLGVLYTVNRNAFKLLKLRKYLNYRLRSSNF